MRVVSHGTVQLFANEAEAVSKATTPFDWGEVKGVDIHGIWILGWA